VGALLQRDREALHDVEVTFGRVLDARPLHLHRDLAATSAISVPAVGHTQPGPVHLGDRRGRHRLRAELGEHLPGRRCELAASMVPPGRSKRT
jgi:hypothetical protein